MNSIPAGPMRYRPETLVAADQRYSLVYRSLDVLDGSPVAIKQIKRAGLSPRQRRFASWMFQREATLLAELHHPCLPGLRDVFEVGGVLHLVMDYLDGETLQQRLDRLRGAGKWLSLDECLHITRNLCSALSYLHSQVPAVIHRDLKPANVILGRDNRVYLLDFSIARRFTQGAIQLLLAPSHRQELGLDTVYNVGSRGYAPPEQYGYTASTSPRADVYGLGALLHYLLSGRDPATKADAELFTFAPLRLPLCPIGDALTARITQMTARDPWVRPTIDAVRETYSSQPLPTDQVALSS